MVRQLFPFVLLFVVAPAHAALAPLESATPQSPAYCGSQYAPPFANRWDGGPRACPAPKPRNYKPRNNVIGVKILDLESQACFVPDEHYQLLDELIGSVAARVTKPVQPGGAVPISDRDRALEIGRVTGEVLAERGFGLLIPTETLSDALAVRSKPGEPPRHVFDCDAGSLMLLSVAEALSMPASLVEITLPRQGTTTFDGPCQAATRSIGT